MLPTPNAREPGWKKLTPVTKKGDTPSHPNQRWYDSKRKIIAERTAAGDRLSTHSSSNRCNCRCGFGENDTLKRTKTALGDDIFRPAIVAA
jgi:hypothetical protein